MQEILTQIDSVHRDLARLSVDQLRGMPSALSTSETLGFYPVPLRPKTTTFLRKRIQEAQTEDEAQRLERVQFACIELVITEQTAALADMLKFYMERGRMIVGSDKIPALEVVPWLQTQTDFDLRETMRSEMTIFLKGIVNPMLLGMLELTVRTVIDRFGFASYASFSEAKKGVSFDRQAEAFRAYLNDTEETYRGLISPWVEEEIGRPLDNLSRYHALHLLRIRRFDEFFPLPSLAGLLAETFKGLGFDLSQRPDVILNISNHADRVPDGMCVGVEIPGEVHVFVKTVGGLIDVETALHELGHAFFLSQVDSSLPTEYRRLYRSAALDEAFAFLFMDLIDNPVWLIGVAGMPPDKADQLAGLVRTKRLCLIRRYMGKFLAEKELHDTGNIKNSEPYCRHLRAATGFTYEPEGYLIDMEMDFYSLDYLMAWAGANVLRGFLETRFGEEWFRRPEAGSFLKEIAMNGRRHPLDHVILEFCGSAPVLPTFANADRGAGRP